MVGDILRALGWVGEKVLPRVFKDKDVLEANIHSEQMAVHNAMSAEFHNRHNRNWFDSLIDGLARLPRIVIAFEVVGLFHWAVLDPISFSVAMTALALVPEWLALIVGQVILLWFGGRMLEQWKGNLYGPNPKHVKEVLTAIAEIKQLEGGRDKPAPDPDSNPEPS